MNSSGLLYVILDTNVSSWSKNSELYKDLVESVLLYINSFLIVNRNNVVYFYVYNQNRSQLIYPKANSTKLYSQIMESHQILNLNTYIFNEIRNFVNSNNSDHIPEINPLLYILSQICCSKI